MAINPGVRWAMRMLGLVVLLAGLLAGVPAGAQSPVGAWRYDREAMAVEARTLAEAMAGRMAPMAKAMAERLPELERRAAELRRRAGNDPAKRAQAEQLERVVAQSRAMAADPAGFYEATILRSYTDERAGLELLADGRAVLTNPALPAPADRSEGTWRQAGEVVTLTFATPEPAGRGGARTAPRTTSLSGPLAGGRLTLGWSAPPVAPGDDPALAAMLAQMRVHLVRR